MDLRDELNPWEHARGGYQAGCGDLRKKKGDYGIWHAERYGVYLADGYGYELDRFKTPGAVLEALAHIGTKTWCTSEVLGDFVRALHDALNFYGY